jgi:hypothetical protein
MSKNYVYGLGGYDTKKPNDNLIAIETYDDETGELISSEKP